MRKPIILSAVFGLGIPVMFMFIWAIVPRMSLGSRVCFENVVFVCWPSSILLMAAGRENWFENLSVFGVSVGINVVLYIIVGMSTWFGLRRRNWWPLIVVGLCLSVIWWRMLTL